MQVEAERRKRAAILESEGKREAAINIAEGEKRARILASEASMQEKINEAKGKVIDLMSFGLFGWNGATFQFFRFLSICSG